MPKPTIFILIGSIIVLYGSVELNLRRFHRGSRTREGASEEVAR